MAQSDILVRIKLLSDEFDKQLKSTKRELDSFSKLGDKLSSGLKRLGSAFVAAAGAEQGFTRTIEATQQTADEFHGTLEAMQSGVDYFFRSLSSGDFSNFLDGLEASISKGRELYNILDTLGDKQASMTAYDAKARYEQSKLRRIIYDPQSTEEQRDAALRDVEQITKELSERTVSISDDLQRAVVAKVEAIVGSKEVPLELIDRYLYEVSAHKDAEYQQYADKYNELRSQVSTTTWSKSGGYYGSKDAAAELRLKQFAEANPQLEQLRQLEQIPDDEREALASWQAERYRLLEQTERYTSTNYRLLRRSETEAKRAAKALSTSTAKVTKSSKQVEQTAIQRIRTEIETLERQLYDAPEEVAAGLRQRIKELQTEEWRLKLKLEVDTTELENVTAIAAPPLVTEVVPTFAGREELRRKLLKEIDDLEVRLRVAVSPEEIDTLEQSIAERRTRIDTLERVGGLTPNAPAPDVQAVTITTDAQQAMEDNLQLIDSFSALTTSIAAVGAAADSSAGQMLQWIATVVSAIGRAIPAITALQAAQRVEANTEVQGAAAKAANSVAGIPLAGPMMAVAAVASVIAAIASVPKFESGGVVGGNSYHGDKILTRLNSGELVLNQSQQSRLSTLIDRTTERTRVDQLGGEVEFKIKGQDLVGLLQKQQRRMART